jgi:hypothetical protein
MHQPPKFLTKYSARIILSYMAEKPNSAKAFDQLYEYYGMPKPNSFVGSGEGDLSVLLGQDPANIRVINCATGEELQPRQSRMTKVAHWIKKLNASRTD